MSTKIDQKRKWFVRLAAQALLLAPFLILLLVVPEIILRLTPRYRDRVPGQCSRWYQPEYHHGYIPNCEFDWSAESKTVHYKFNEDGLRDRPRAEFENHPTLMTLGDSIVLGLQLSPEETIAGVLEKRYAATERRVLNAGIRVSSPTTESLLYRKIHKLYPIDAVVVFINGTDVIDERLFFAAADKFDASGLPVHFKRDDWNYWLPKDGVALHLLLRTALYPALNEWWRYRSWKELVNSVPATPARLCAGALRLAKWLQKDGHPFLFIATPHPGEGVQNVWAGLPYNAPELDEMLSCLKANEVPLLDLSHEKLPLDWFLSDLIHYRPPAVHWLIEKAGPMIDDLVKKADKQTSTTKD